jgi:hypothetical protein
MSRKWLSAFRITLKLLVAGALILAANTSARATVQLGTGFNGLAQQDTWWWPNDPNSAVGPNYVVEIINGVYRIYTKSGTLISTNDTDNLFKSINPNVGTLDPNIFYDNIAQRFVIEANGSYGDIVTAYFAVSNSSDPTQGFTEVHSINFPNAHDGSKMGFNADAYFVCATSGMAIIQKSSVLDKNNSTYNQTFIDTNNYYGRPCRMYGSSPGGPEFLTYAGSNGMLHVKRIDNVLSSSPTFTDFDVAGSSGCSDPATASWRNNSLVTANTGSMYWWQVDTSGATPTLVQQGLISAPSGYVTAYGSACIAPNGDIGVTYMQFSADSTALPVSMYVAGRKASDPLGTMSTPIAAVTSSYTQSNQRHGDYSSIECDIDSSGNTLNTFWATNGYINAANNGEASWNQSFSATGDLSNGTYTLTPQNATGSRLDAAASGRSNGTVVDIWGANGGSNQKWIFTNMGGWYKVQPSYDTALCLDVIGGSSTPGAYVDLWADNGGTNQRWKATQISGSVYNLAPENALTLYLDVYGGSSSNGTRVDVWNGTGTQSNEEWVIGAN